MNKAEGKGKKCAEKSKRACEFRKAKLVSKSLICDAVIPAPFLFLHGKIFLCASFQQKLGSKAKPCVQRPAFFAC